VVDQTRFLFESEKLVHVGRNASLSCSNRRVSGQAAGEAAKARDNATGLSVGIGQGSTKLLLAGATVGGRTSDGVMGTFEQMKAVRQLKGLSLRPKMLMTVVRIDLIKNSKSSNLKLSLLATSLVFPYQMYVFKLLFMN